MGRTALGTLRGVAPSRVSSGIHLLWENLLSTGVRMDTIQMESDIQHSRFGTLIGRRRVKRKIRHVMEIAIPLLGIEIIFLSVLFAPDSLQT